LLIGLLTPDPDPEIVHINVQWLSDPVSNLKNCGARLPDLVALFDATLGPASDHGPAIFADARWYPIPDPVTGVPTAFHIVATAPTNATGQIGLGALDRNAVAAVSATAYAYLPVFSYDASGAKLILDSATDPCRMGVGITASTPFSVQNGSGTVTFTSVTVVGSLYLDEAAYRSTAAAPLIEVDFENLNGSSKPSSYTSLAALLDPDVEAWLLEVVFQSGPWLSFYIGNTAFTFGDVLLATGLLRRNDLFQSANFVDSAALTALLIAGERDPVSAYVWSKLPTADQAVLSDASSTPAQQVAALIDGLDSILQAGLPLYDPARFSGVALSPQTYVLLAQDPAGAELVRLNRLLLEDSYRALLRSNPFSVSLSELHGSASEIALNLLFGALNALSLAGEPIMFLPGGGIHVTARENADGHSKDYGLRLLLDLSLSEGTPGGSSPAVDLCLGSWLTGESDSDNWMIRSGGAAAGFEPGVSFFLLNRDAQGKVAFAPGFELVSIGFNLAGAANKPLVGLDGYTLGGTDLRLFLFPGDPIARPSQWQYGFAVRLDNFGFPLTPRTGSGDAANPVAMSFFASGSGDSEPVNPSFSAAFAWRSDSTNSPKVNARIYGSDGTPSGIAWVPVQRAFGPVMCQRIGIAIDTSVPLLTIFFDGDVALGPLEIDLIDLSIGVPIATPLTLEDYGLGLKGLALSYESGPLTIVGGLDENSNVTPTAYDGEALIQAASWSISAIGSYASTGAPPSPSLFVFARLAEPIGGPPFFFVTGLCAGFGYNRSLILPGQADVPSFPLLAGIADANAVGGAQATPADVLEKLGEAVPVVRGANWFAAGVQFTSFELVQSNALLAVLVTGDFEAAILGLSRLKLPQTASDPFAYVELGIDIVLHPSAGFFGATAVITPNSYVIDPACHLTGGFAFYVWFAAPKDGGADHSGDFIVTVGGYHPAFVKPSWYPEEPRLGFSWQVTGDLTVTGSAYFALTPSCVMGGGALDVEFHSGNLRAWFTAQSDFLFHWKPYYFSGDISVSIGASYKIDLGFCSFTPSVELGATLSLTGPPTAGRVTIDWTIISFSIPFGPDSSPPHAKIKWCEFSQLLPQPGSPPAPGALTAAYRSNADAPGIDTDALGTICTFAIGCGLSSTLNDTTSQRGLRWIVRADSFSFSIKTAFPLTGIQNDMGIGPPYTALYPEPADPTPSVAVRPMGISSNDMESTLLVGLQDGSGQYQSLSSWNFTPDLGAVPAALWGEPQPGTQPAVPTADTLPGSLLGLRSIEAPPPALVGPPEIPLINLAFDTIDQLGSDFLPLSSEQAAVAPNAAASATSLGVIAATVADPVVAKNRDDLFAALFEFGYSPGQNGGTGELAAKVNEGYRDPPMLGAPWPCAPGNTDVHA
jgi:hypothetical protein